jgi:multiple sugar transport system ATP-binding protein
MAEIELQSVVKRFSGTTALRETSFTIHDGEFFILVGPSGCGKSTLLNLIVGLEEPSAGEIRVDGARVNGRSPRDRNMAMVFQSYAIYPHMTVRENMAFPLKLARLPREEIERRVAQAAKILELGELLDRKPHALSGGQRQRVAMGRAIVREPSVFLLDEPLSNLDAKLRVQMRTELARLQRQLGTTTIYVTHDQTEAMTLGDRIAVMNRGELLQIGSPRQLYEHPANLFVAGFIGAPAMNFLPARWHHGGLELPLGRFAFPYDDLSDAMQSASALIVGFRPEHLHVLDEGQRADSGLSFTVRVEVLEWLGAELYVYFDVDLQDFTQMNLPQDLDIDSGNAARQVLVASIDPARGVKEGDPLRLHLDPADIQVFDAATARNLCQQA